MRACLAPVADRSADGRSGAWHHHSAEMNGESHTMARNHLVQVIQLSLLACVLAACQHPTQMVSTTIEPRPRCDFNALVAQRPAASQPAMVSSVPASMTEMPLNSVNLTDWTITNKVMVQSTNARRTPTGTVEVWARLVNCTDYPLQVEGRTHFLDDGRSPIEDASAWNRVFLPARSFAVYTEHSTNTARVKYYFVELREGR